MIDLSGYTYRPAVGVMLINGAGKVWVKEVELLKAPLPAKP